MSTDSQWFSRMLEETVVKQFCSPRDDPKTEMAAISEETFSQSQSVSHVFALKKDYGPVSLWNGCVLERVAFAHQTDASTLLSGHMDNIHHYF